MTNLKQRKKLLEHRIAFMETGMLDLILMKADPEAIKKVAHSIHIDRMELKFMPE